MSDILFELMESNALEKYYIDNAKSPGITIQCGVFTAPDAKKGQHYTVYFGNAIGHWNFSNLNKARAKAEEILAKAVYPITVTVKHRNGKVLRTLSIVPKSTESKQ